MSTTVMQASFSILLVIIMGLADGIHDWVKPDADYLDWSRLKDVPVCLRTPAGLSNLFPPFFLTSRTFP
jgi:hypothetical protein